MKFSATIRLLWFASALLSYASAEDSAPAAVPQATTSPAPEGEAGDAPTTVAEMDLVGALEDYAYEDEGGGLDSSAVVDAPSPSEVVNPASSSPSPSTSPVLLGSVASNFRFLQPTLGWVPNWPSDILPASVTTTAEPEETTRTIDTTPSSLSASESLAPSFTVSKVPVTEYYFDLSSVAPTPIPGPLHDPAGSGDPLGPALTSVDLTSPSGLPSSPTTSSSSPGPLESLTRPFVDLEFRAPELFSSVVGEAVVLTSSTPSLPSSVASSATSIQVLPSPTLAIQPTAQITPQPSVAPEELGTNHLSSDEDTPEATETTPSTEAAVVPSSVNGTSPSPPPQPLLDITNSADFYTDEADLGTANYEDLPDGLLPTALGPLTPSSSLESDSFTGDQISPSGVATPLSSVDPGSETPTTITRSALASLSTSSRIVDLAAVERPLITSSPSRTPLWMLLSKSERPLAASLPRATATSSSPASSSPTTQIPSPQHTEMPSSALIIPSLALFPSSESPSTLVSPTPTLVIDTVSSTAPAATLAASDLEPTSAQPPLPSTIHETSSGSPIADEDSLESSSSLTPTAATEPDEGTIFLSSVAPAVDALSPSLALDSVSPSQTPDLLSSTPVFDVVSLSLAPDTTPSPSLPEDTPFPTLAPDTPFTILAPDTASPTSVVPDRTTPLPTIPLSPASDAPTTTPTALPPLTTRPAPPPVDKNATTHVFPFVVETLPSSGDPEETHLDELPPPPTPPTTPSATVPLPNPASETPETGTPFPDEGRLPAWPGRPPTTMTATTTMSPQGPETGPTVPTSSEEGPGESSKSASVEFPEGEVPDLEPAERDSGSSSADETSEGKEDGSGFPISMTPTTSDVGLEPSPPPSGIHPFPADGSTHTFSDERPPIEVVPTLQVDPVPINSTKVRYDVTDLTLSTDPSIVPLDSPSGVPESPITSSRPPSEPSSTYVSSAVPSPLPSATFDMEPVSSQEPIPLPSSSTVLVEVPTSFSSYPSDSIPITFPSVTTTPTTTSVVAVRPQQEQPILTATPLSTTPTVPSTSQEEELETRSPSVVPVEEIFPVSSSSLMESPISPTLVSPAVGSTFGPELTSVVPTPTASKEVTTSAVTTGTFPPPIPEEGEEAEEDKHTEQGVPETEATQPETGVTTASQPSSTTTSSTITQAESAETTTESQTEAPMAPLPESSTPYMPPPTLPTITTTSTTTTTTAPPTTTETTGSQPDAFTPTEPIPVLKTEVVLGNGSVAQVAMPFVRVLLSATPAEFCLHQEDYKTIFAKWLDTVRDEDEPEVKPEEIVFFEGPDCNEEQYSRNQGTNPETEHNLESIDGLEIASLVAEEVEGGGGEGEEATDTESVLETNGTTTYVYFFVERDDHMVPELTERFPLLPTELSLNPELEELRRKVKQVEVVRPKDSHFLQETEEGVGASVIAIIVVATIVGVSVIGALVFFMVVRRRQQDSNYYGSRCRPVSMDAYSMDSVSVYHSFRRKSKRRASNRSIKSYLNQAFDDPNGPSRPLNFAKLTHIMSDIDGVHEEFGTIPVNMPKYDEMPPGVEEKNRYANVIPVPETRVLLKNLKDKPNSEYINANYVRGPRNESKYYIATQAPMDETVPDFWRMIWEQESKVIVMLTDFVEKGIDKCADYLPPSETLDCHRLYGDFQVTLKSRDMREKYVVSHVQLKNLENNLIREIAHLWYTGWPSSGVPNEESTFISFILDVRRLRKQLRAKGPIVVHCSPGTGRTGAFLASDMGIKTFEDQRMVDVLKTVYVIRRDRAGAVQTKEQYAFVYRVVNLYASKLTTGNLDSL